MPEANARAEETRGVSRRMQARRGDRSGNGTAREDGGKRESDVRRCAREKTSEAENRESGGIRALISVSGPSRGDEKGVEGALTREILIPC